MYAIISDKNILLVGRDNAELAELKAYLESGACRIETAETAKQAMTTVNEVNPDLVVINDVLAGGTAIEVCEAIKAHPVLSATPVVMIVPFGDAEDKLGCLEAGADEVLIKPVERRELLACVVRAVKTRTFTNHQISVENVIQSLNIAIEEKDHYTRGHSVRVAEYAVQLAKSVGVPEAEIKVIYRACMLHDIGQIALEESILHKPGALSEQELAAMRQHPDIAVKILEPLHFPRELLEIIRHHHEWWNGHGYPDGLSRNKIPVGARILAITDSFDAMVSERPYRAKMSLQMALNRLEDGANRQWDPDLVKAFLGIEQAVLEKEPAKYKHARLWQQS